MDQTSLYRFYDSDDRLLYVGITVHLPKRFDRHRSDKPWWTDIAHIDVEQYPDRAAALEAEREAIRTERPLWNVQHAVLPAGRSVVVVWPCAACGEAVADAAGYLEVRHADIVAYDKGKQRWEASHEPPEGGFRSISIAELLAAPDPAPWRAWHTRCDPEPGASAYWIATERIRSAWDVIDWTAHLMEKGWLSSTDWADLLRSVHERSGSGA